MKRRKFVYLTALGALGLSGAGLFFRRSGVTTDEKNLIDWLQGIGAKRHYTLFQMDQSLEKAHEAAYASWKKIGYKALDTSGYYSIHNGNKALFPISLHSADIGLITTALLSFEKTDNGEWVALTPLYGVQLEALYKATHALSATIETRLMEQYLLPVYSRRAQAAGYLTNRGKVLIHCNTRKNERAVSAKILNNGKEIWSSNYESNHLLT